MTRVPARCNRRACQARRNLSKPLAEYVRPPRCHTVGCDGLMYVDKYRLNRGAKDRAAACYEGCLHDAQIGWPFEKPHRVDHPACRHYEDYMAGRRGVVVDDDEAPF